MAHQNESLKERGLQAARDPVVVLANDLNELGVSFDTVRAELLRSPHIEAVAATSQSPWSSGGNHVSLTRGAEAGAAREDTIFNYIGYHFFDAIELKLLAGRLLDREHGDESVPYPQDKEQRIVVDRALAAVLGWHDPNVAVNKIAYSKWGSRQNPYRIVGVVENGYPRLVGPNTASNAYALAPQLAGLTLIRLSREHVAEAMRHIDSTWNSVSPKVQIRREFMDALFYGAYRNYATINSVLNGLAAFAFLIAVLGLCGLAMHVTSRRRREIGIRKTLGATVRGVVAMLLIDFAKPVVAANLVAWPFAWLVGQAYLQRFTLRSEITVWPFVLSLVITVGIAWASVAFQALRAATVKPASVLHVQ
jgi:putative ABC transport system permease protein